MKLPELFASFTPGHALQRPYIIAEAGMNHEGDMHLAKRLVDEAAEGGAHAIKFQTYKASTLASRHSPAYWDTNKEPTESQFELFSKYDKFWKGEFEALKTYCDEAGIEFLSTPFDVASAIFLNDLMDAFKISSSDLTNRPFIEKLCEFGKPVILSTGASNHDEIAEAVGWIGDTPLALLHCILNYPTDDRLAHLGMIKDLQRTYPDNIIGYSDHTLPKDMRCLEVATLLGAVILEKHFTHDKTLPGNDHYHAMDKDDLKLFHNNLDRVFTLLGSFDKKALDEEAPAREHARRSLVAARDIEVGATITHEDLTFKRPAHGISPKDINDVVGKKAKQAIEEDAIMEWDLLE